jgi:asparagine synthetase B (glutamine-hydrolysing)
MGGITIMDYLAFRYTSTKFKSPIDFNNKVIRVNPNEIEKRLKCKGDAVFLSGGLDSSLLTAINRPKMAYVARFPGFDEEYIRASRVVGHLNIPLTSVMITRERYLSTIEFLISKKGDGLHPNEPCLYLIAKQAKKDGYKTILSGEGADGYFGGYTDLLSNEDKTMSNEMAFRLRYLIFNTQDVIPFEKWQKWGMYRFLIEVHEPALIDRAYNACSSAGIKVLFPYTLNGIPQMMWEAPMGQKIDKPILKEIALKYLPKDIIYQKKIGFPTPWNVNEFLLLNKEIGW